RALRLRARAVDLVGEDDLREDRPRMKAEGRALAVEDRHADDVGGQEIGGELDALVVEAEEARERVRERGLADAGHVLDQQVAAREDARHREADLPLLAEDHLAGERDDRLYGSGGDAAANVDQHEMRCLVGATNPSMWTRRHADRSRMRAWRRHCSRTRTA